MLATTTKINGGLLAAIERLEGKVKADVLRAGAGAASNHLYGLVSLNTSGINAEAGFPNLISGQLHRSIYQYHVTDKSGDFLQTYHVGPNRRKAPHWALVEFGTSRAPAHPYIRPAFDHMSEAIAVGRQRMAEKLGSL